MLGFSMGAQQAYEWAVRFPGAVERLAVFAGLARTTPGNGLLVAAAEEALRTGGTGQHARFWAATGLSAELYRREAWRDAGYVSVDDMVRRLFEDDYAACDPADLLCQLGKWRRADVSRQTGADLAEALGRITARTVVAPVLARRLVPRRRLRGRATADRREPTPGRRERLGALRLGDRARARQPRSSASDRRCSLKLAT